MSPALPQTTDIGRRGWQVSSVPRADSCTAANCVLFDHLVGAGEHRRRHSEAEGLRSNQVDDQIEFGRLLDRNVGRLLSTRSAPRR
jgi:hypothetical protein